MVKRLEKQLETLPYSCDPPEWEALLVQFNKELHPDHFLCMKVSVTVFVTASVIAFVTVFVFTTSNNHLPTIKQLENNDNPKVKRLLLQLYGSREGYRWYIF